jgi:hypothetical protein
VCPALSGYYAGQYALYFGVGAKVRLTTIVSVAELERAISTRVWEEAYDPPNPSNNRTRAMYDDEVAALNDWLAAAPE